MFAFKSQMFSTIVQTVRHTGRRHTAGRHIGRTKMPSKKPKNPPKNPYIPKKVIGVKTASGDMLYFQKT